MSLLYYPHRDVIYFHVPKTGGTSLKDHLSNGINNKAKKKWGDAHLELLRPTEMRAAVPELYARTRKIKTHRNTWERIRSAYVGQNIQMPFGDFVDRLVRMLPDNPFIYVTTVTSQMYWVEPDIESFNTEDLDKVFPGIKRLNVSNTNKPVYTDETLNKVGDLYREEIDLFGFKPPSI